MDNDRVRKGIPGVTVRVAGVEFDNVFYDAEVDVLYLHVGDPGTAVDFDATSEGHHTRYGAGGSLVGLTILNPRRLLEDEGKIVLTLPEQRVEATDLGDALVAA
jgi:uncharacterized protein YuzE